MRRRKRERGKGRVTDQFFLPQGGKREERKNTYIIKILEMAGKTTWGGRKKEKESVLLLLSRRGGKDRSFL